MTIRFAAALLPWLAASAQTPAFTDAARVEKLRGAFPEVEKIVAKWAATMGVPGLSWGMVIDGEAPILRATGVREWPAKKPVEAGTPFRIASMTKSFTALAILKLRDEGKLSLDDEVSRWIPEAASFRYPTADTAPLRVRQLLTHGAGFPEDNPWGDQQLGLPFGELNDWLRRGIPWSTAPDTAYEYSNYGFGLLGRIVERASGRTYRDYLQREILEPLRMTNSTLEPAEARDAAVGYRRDGASGYRAEPSIPHGAFGAMGGLVTTAPDLARYVAFHLAAHPPRDGAETGPVRRSSVREMQRLWRTSGGIEARRTDLRAARVAGYGYGLRVTSDCRFDHIVGHGGGLPGFGSYMLWLPEHGVGLFGMSNLTYTSPMRALDEGLNALRKSGGLVTRELAPAPVLTRTQQALFALWKQWNQADADRLAANNLFLDTAAAERQAQIAKLKESARECALSGPVRPENWLRGDFDLACAQGTRVRMVFTLAPTSPEPTVQHWSMQVIQPPGAVMRKAALRALQAKDVASTYGACRLGETRSGDGVRQSTIRLECERGSADLELTLNEKGKTIASQVTGTGACAP